MIVRTEAIVLRGLNYSETSKIVQLFTMDDGHITVIAKGSRKPGSKFGSCLEPCSIIDAIYYYKSERNIQTLSDCSHLNRLKSLSTNLDRYSAAIRIIEFLSKLEINSSHRKGVFQMVTLMLDALDSTDANPVAIWNCLRLRLLGLLGFEPAFEKEDVANIGIDGGVLNLSDGRITTDGHGDAGHMMLKASRIGLRTFSILSRADLGHVLGLETDAPTMDEVERLVGAFVSYHLPHIPLSRASRILAEMMDS